MTISRIISGNGFEPNEVIRSQDFDDEFNNLIAGVNLTDSQKLSRDGTQQMLGDLPMGGHRLTNLPISIASGNAVEHDQLLGLLSTINASLADLLSQINSNDADISSIETNRIHRDGSVSMTGNLSLNSNNIIDLAKAENSGDAVALDAQGFIPLSNIPASLQGSSSFQGTWDARLDLPDLSSTGVASLRKTLPTGSYYIVSNISGGAVPDLDSIVGANISLGDQIILNEDDTWARIPTFNSVTSVNSQTGTVVLNKSDVGLSNVTNEAQLRLTDLTTIVNSSSDNSKVPTALAVFGAIPVDNVNLANSSDYRNSGQVDTAIDSKISTAIAGTIQTNINSSPSSADSNSILRVEFNSVGETSSIDITVAEVNDVSRSCYLSVSTQYEGDIDGHSEEETTHLTILRAKGSTIWHRVGVRESITGDISNGTNLFWDEFSITFPDANTARLTCTSENNSQSEVTRQYSFGIAGLSFV